MKIALLTCQKFPELYITDQSLIPELSKYNIEATAAIWDDPTINWTQFDYLLFRNTWDYYEKETAFNQWLDHIEKCGVRTLNPIQIIKQNKHKFYLREMQRQGIPIIPTIFIEKDTSFNLAGHMPPDWEKAVIKPAFSAGSYLTELFDRKDIEFINAKYRSIATSKDLLLQKFMPEIETLGEASLIFFNKKFSHAVNKMPAQGDFRIQIQYGGKYTPFHPDEKLLLQVQKIVAGLPDPLLYARIDGIVIGNQLQLMEIECIEPDLYFNLSEGAQQRFVNAIVELIE